MTPGMPYSVRVRIPADAYFMNPGVRPSVSGYAVQIDPVNGPSGQVWERPVKFFGALRERLNTAIKNSLSPGSAPFIMALITGERGLLTKETNNYFSVTGLSHILHKAGLHFGLLLFFFFQSTRFLVKALPYKLFSVLTLYTSPSQIAALVCLPLMIGYLGISPPDFGTFRAFIMICFFLFGLLLERKRFWLNSLTAAVFLIVLYRPDSLTDLSFQLSFVSVLCIGIVAGGEESRDKKNNSGDTLLNSSELSKVSPELFSPELFPVFSRMRSSIVSYARSSVLITFAANAGTAPLIINSFHIFSIVSPLANLIVIPAVGFIILPLAFLSSFAFLLFNVFPLYSVLDALTSHVLSFVNYMGRWEFMAVSVPAFPAVLLIFFYAGLGIYTVTIHAGRFPLFRSLLFPCAIAIVPMAIFLVCSFSGKDRLSVTFLDVGQGDGAVIELPDRRTMIMDTGKSGIQVGEFLRYRGINKIDALILSHPDNDHVGGAGYLLNNFKVHEIWDNSRMEYKEGFPGNAGHRGLQRGDTIRGAGYSIMALHPYRGFYSGSGKRFDENNDSLLLRVQGAAASFLFTGDLEKEGEADAVHIGCWIKSTVLKVAHHGSRSSSSEIFINAVSPEIAVISAGRNNSYGHPHPETLEVLSRCRARCRVFRTDREGAIKISEGDSGKVLVKTWKYFQITEAKGIRDEWMNINRLFWVW
ncbi:MAG: ComEC/Rec2 family competence protein [Nitrospirae bacterium]|nr:ComEC/Rec2 family competence protein [Nitrospirota bacterium]